MCIVNSKNALSIFSYYYSPMPHGMSEADKLAIIKGGHLRYMWLGATYTLSGYDHLALI